MENKYGITKYNFWREIQAFCPLGNDFYTCKIVVEFFPNKIVFDFCEIDKKIQELSGKEMIIEELVNSVYSELKKFSPIQLKVEGIAKSNTHFDVIVTKE